MAKKRITVMMRVYPEDLQEVRMRFPRVRSADFFHQSVRTNPYIQLEAALRGKPKKSKKR